jgi:hypothetical protein
LENGGEFLSVNRYGGWRWNGDLHL